MLTHYHILNGDSLKEQFPKSIQGKIIVARECLVDGNVEGGNLEEFYKTRAKFIALNYSGYTEEEYHNKTVTEFEKIQAIPSKSKVYMWFEDDLFCQVNFWFVASLLIEKKEDSLLFLVRPSEHSPYSFGHLKESELISSYENGIPLNKNIEEISSLWQFYKQNDLQNLLKTAQTLSSIYPFILKAVEAHIERQPSHNKLGRPKESIIQIMKELDTKEFAPVFREFTKREAIYGFGDLQVKRMFEEITNS